MEFTALNGHEAYAQVAAAVLSPGKIRHRSARGLLTRDLGFVTIKIIDASQPILPLGTRPGLNTKIAAIEAAQLVAGVSTTNLITELTPTLNRFREENGHFHGAYGTRIKDQVTSVVEKLTNDSESRQAVITLWDPELDNEPGKRDYPCTVGMQFEINNDALYMSVIMRSNDIWLGLPLDLFQFSQLQRSVARALGVPVGSYRHTSWSMHAYEENIPQLDDVDYRNAAEQTEPNGFGAHGDTWQTIKGRAMSILDAPPVYPITSSEMWYLTRLRPTITIDFSRVIDDK